MKCLPPKEYESLNPLAEPAGYIIVVRDIDRDTFRIDGTANPGRYMEDLQGEAERRFGIELVSILETEDLSASELELYDRHHARLSEQWLKLDSYQVEELRRSFLQIDAYASHYLTPDHEAAPAGAALDRTAPRQERRPTRYDGSAGAYRRVSSEAMGFRRAYAQRSPQARWPGYRRYAESLRRYREENPERRVDISDDPFAWMMQQSRRADEFFRNWPGQGCKVCSGVLAGYSSLRHGCGTLTAVPAQPGIDAHSNQTSSVRLIGQWSLPITSAWISAVTSLSSKSGEMKK